VTTIGNSWLWLGFGVFVVAALIVDFVVLKKEGAHRVGVREAAIWSAIWVALSVVFAALLWWWLTTTTDADTAKTRTIEFLTGYLIEKSLAVDNIFLFLTIFTYFGLRSEYQKRALMIGIVAAIVLRTAMIFGGAYLIVAKPLYLSSAALVLHFDSRAIPDIDRNKTPSQLEGSNEHREVLYSDADILRSPDRARKVIETIGLPRLYPDISANTLDEAAKLDESAGTRQPEVSSQGAVHRLVIYACRAIGVFAGDFSCPGEVANMLRRYEWRGNRGIRGFRRDKRLGGHVLRLFDRGDLLPDLLHHLLELLKLALQLIDVRGLSHAGYGASEEDEKNISWGCLFHGCLTNRLVTNRDSDAGVEHIRQNLFAVYPFKNVRSK